MRVGLGFSLLFGLLGLGSGLELQLGSVLLACGTFFCQQKVSGHHYPLHPSATTRDDRRVSMSHKLLASKISARRSSRSMHMTRTRSFATFPNAATRRRLKIASFPCLVSAASVCLGILTLKEEKVPGSGGLPTSVSMLSLPASLCEAPQSVVPIRGGNAEKAIPYSQKINDTRRPQVGLGLGLGLG